MLTSLNIEGFKAVKMATIPLQPLTLFIGRNGSGKSSAIEVLQWVQEALLGGLEAATTGRFGRFEDLINRRTSRVRLNLEWDLPKYHVRYGLWVKPHSTSAAIRPPIVEHEECVVGRKKGAQWIIRSKKGGTGPAVRSVHLGYPVREGDELALARLDMRRQPSAVGAFAEFLRKAVFLRLSPSVIGQVSNLHPRGRGPILDEEGRRLVALLNAMKSSQRDRVLDRVRAVLESATNVKVVRHGDTGHIAVTERMRTRGGTGEFDIPGWLLSEGTRRIVAIFAVLEVRPRPPMIVIEEIENGLDPWTLTMIFDALRDAAADGTQVLLTTHSPYLLDHVEPAQVVHVRRENGDTTYTPMKDYEQVLKYEGVVAPGAMYVSDYLAKASNRSSS